MSIERAKTIDLFSGKELTKEQEYNTVTNKNEIKHNVVILDSLPQRLVLELTNVCDLKCIMCGRDEAEFKQTFFDVKILGELDNVLNKVEEVTLFGWGEPTMHPKFSNILQILDKYPVRKYFVTNGSFLEKIYDDLFKYHVDIMAISVDGACASTNNNIRLQGDFDKIISNLIMIVERRKKSNTIFPYINFVMTLMDDNLEELPDLVRLAADIGIEEVKAVYLTSFSIDMRDQILLGQVDRVRSVFDNACEVASDLGIKIKLPYLQGEDVAGDNYHKPCYVGVRDMFIGSDGYIRPCQSTSEKLFKYNKYSTFEEKWNSSEYISFRKRVNDNNTMSLQCKRCYQSSHANWNNDISFNQENMAFAPDWIRDKKAL